jgi:SAM-dependent methyltransferase
MRRYHYRPSKKLERFSEGMAALERMNYKVVQSAVDNASAGMVQRIVENAKTRGLEFLPTDIDLGDYRDYFSKAGYATRYLDYYRDNQKEKSLEHYVALKLLNLHRGDVFIDIASEHSPVPEIYSRLTGAVTYRQDIMYPEGIHGNCIEGDACSMPVPDGFASKAILTCSLEHFEGDGDTHLFLELHRILRPKGIVCVIPFYIFTDPVTQTDPTVSVPAGVVFDKDTTLYCAEGWGNRHGRFYSPQSFIQRVMNPIKDKFKFDFFYFRNASEIYPSIYLRFAFTSTRL